MIALSWDGELMTGDVQLGRSGLVRDDGLTTAVLISLFTDRRAKADDPLPDGNDRRGWVGDAISPVDGDRIGSRLWLLRREKQTEETRRRAEEYAREALAWLIEDGLAARVEVSAEWVARGVLGCLIVIHLAAGGVERLAVNIAAGAA